MCRISRATSIISGQEQHKRNMPRVIITGKILTHKLIVAVVKGLLCRDGRDHSIGWIKYQGWLSM